MIVLLTDDEYNFLQSYELVPLDIETKIYPHPYGIKTYIDVTCVIRVGEEFYISYDSGVTYVKTEVRA